MKKPSELHIWAWLTMAAALAFCVWYFVADLTPGDTAERARGWVEGAHVWGLIPTLFYAAWVYVLLLPLVLCLGLTFLLAGLWQLFLYRRMPRAFSVTYILWLITQALAVVTGLFALLNLGAPGILGLPALALLVLIIARGGRLRTRFASPGGRELT